MPKDFDSTLSDALDLAALSAQTAGPNAARIRGRQRTMRKRIALSTASLALIAVGATAAFKVASPGHGGAPMMTKPSPSVSVAASAPPTLTPSYSTSSAPSTAASGSATSGPSTNPSTSSSPPMSAPTAADPLKFVDTAWLSPSQIPFDSTFNWTANKAQSGVPGWQTLSPNVNYFPSDDSRQSLTTCGDPSAFLSRTIGGQGTSFAPTTPPVTATENNQASQDIFFFSSAKSAQAAFTWLLSQYDSTCFSTFQGAQFTKTAASSTEATWLMLKGTSGSPDLPKYSREYFMLRGSTITYVSVLSYSQTLPTTYDDVTQLNTIAGHSCAYGGSCRQQ